jgi:hypothetical protein
VDQVQEADAEPAIAFCVRDDEPEVGFDQTRQRRLVAILLDAAAELALLVHGQARQLGDFAEIRAERAGVVFAARHVRESTTVFSLLMRLDEIGGR